MNKQQIFSRQVINENMFGKLTLLPNGDLYANVNKACLGNVLHKSLNEIIGKEEYKIFDKYITLDAELINEERKRGFILGFKLANRLMIESMKE